MEGSKLSGWSLLSEGEAKGSIRRDRTSPRDETTPHSLRLTVTRPDSRCGIAYDPGSGFDIKAGQWYDLSFFARTEKRDIDRGYGLTVSLERQDGRIICARTTIPEVGGDWTQYTLALDAYQSHSNARLVITMSEPGTIWLDNVALTARSPVKKN